MDRVDVVLKQGFSWYTDSVEIAEWKVCEES